MSKVNHVKADQKEFVEEIQTLTNRFQLWQVWSDFVLMFSTAISNSVDKVHFEKREALYLQVIKKYNKKEQQVFPRLCAIVISALQEDPDRDFLGELYMALELGNHYKGQFFTPYSLCKAMVELNAESILEEIKHKGFIPVNDPASGAGATLIAYANIAKDKLKGSGLNFQNHILFTAQDIDMVTGLMCYIQLSLLGCAGYVKIGDTLINPMTGSESKVALNNQDNTDYWFTPMYFSEVWHYRRLFHSMDNFFRKEAKQ